VPGFLREALAGTPCIRPLHPCRRTRRIVRSTRVPTAEPLRAPLIRSPSQWPGTVRVATSAGRSVIVPTPAPSSGANGHGSGPDLRSHVLQHSCADRIFWHGNTLAH
jgi:hypothetical protein